MATRHRPLTPKLPGTAARDVAVPFARAAAASACVVVSVALATGAAAAMYTFLITLLVAAFLPFVLTLAVFALVLAAYLVAIALSLAVEDGSPIELVSIGIEVGAEAAGESALEQVGKATPAYYRLIASQRHPAFWGVPAGIAIGILALWGWQAATRLPREADTAAALAEAAAAIERYREEHKKYPPQGALSWDELGAEGRSGPVLDAWGNPLDYEVKQVWRVGEFSLRSRGADGRDGGGDDLCLGGRTKLAEKLRALPAGVRLQGVRAKLAALAEVRC